MLASRSRSRDRRKYVSNRKLIQHRIQRDTSKKETADLKKENQRLKRQVARLRKRLDRDDIDLDIESLTEENDVQKDKCPMCGSTDLGIIQTPSNKTIVSCKSCKKWRNT